MSEIKVDKISPQSGTALAIGDSGDTITIPSGATITNSGTANGFGGGKLGQLVIGEDSTATTIATTTYTDVGLSVDITPSATTSDVFIQFNMHGRNQHDEGFGMRLLRDTTVLWTSTTTDHAYEAGATDVRLTPTVFFKDTAISTTSQVTYKVQCATQNSKSIEFNISGDKTQIVAMEILA